MRKILIVLGILFSTNICLAQLKKINSIKLDDIYNKKLLSDDNFYYDFKVKNNFIYVCSEGKILKINNKGLVLDSICTLDINKNKSNSFEFYFSSNENNNDDSLFYSIESDQLINIIQSRKLIKSITLNEVLKNKNDTVHYDYFSFCIDKNNNLYIRHSGSYKNDGVWNHDSYLSVVKKDSIFTNKLPANAFHTNFKIYDSLLIFLTEPNGGSSILVMNISSLQQLKLLNLHKFLKLNSESIALKTRLISVEGKMCYLVVSQYNTNIDYIVELNLSNYQLKKKLKVGNILYNKQYFKKNELLNFGEKSSSFFVSHEYPNRRMYSIENGLLYILSENRGKKLVDIYKL